MVLMKMEEVEVALMKMEEVVVVFLQEKLHRLNLKNLWGYLPPEANNRDLHLHLHLLQMEVHPNSEFYRQHRNLVLEILELIFFPILDVIGRKSFSVFNSPNSSFTFLSLKAFRTFFR